MRKPEYLSPSSLSYYEKSPEEYYLRYLADNKPEREPQTPAMSVGSAFDAYAKSYLHDKIYGPTHADAAKYGLRAIFEAQVSPSNRDEAWKVGAYLFAQYKASGALSDLMTEIQGAIDEPKFEFDVKGVIHGVREGIAGKKFGVPLLGKPDLRFVNKDGADVIYDWKVNGWFAKSNTSPMAGYLQCREQQGANFLRKGGHKDAVPMLHRGIFINVAGYLEDWNEDWAVQLATYSWLMGSAVGVENIIGIDQIVCHGAKRDPVTDYPNLRIVSHRARVSSKFQHTAIQKYVNLWGLITDEPFYFFRDLPYEDSKDRCKMLDGRTQMLTDLTLSADEQWLLSIAKPRQVW